MQTTALLRSFRPEVDIRTVIPAMVQVTATTSTCASVFIVDTTKVKFDKTCPRAPAETRTGDYKLWDRIRYETKLQGPDKTEEELCGISEI